MPQNTEISIPEFKCVIVGDGGVGKTNFTRKIAGYQFTPLYTATLGVEVTPAVISYHKNNSSKQSPENNFLRQSLVKLNVWDTAGQEKFGGLRDVYYVNADCAFVFFDLTSKITFKNVQKWILDISNPLFGYVVKPINKIVVIGNKKDLDKSRVITKEEVLQFLPPYIPYVEISVKHNQGIDLAIKEMLHKLNLM